MQAKHPCQHISPCIIMQHTDIVFSERSKLALRFYAPPGMVITVKCTLQKSMPLSQPSKCCGR